MTVYLSNRLEILAEHLTVKLFTSSSLFSKDLIIVPNFAIKEWLSFYFADHSPYQIALGMQVLYLDQAIDLLVKRQKKMLSPIGKILKIKEEAGDEISLAVCQTLASLFSLYGTYGGNYLEKVRKGPKNIQERIWQSFATNYSYPYEILNAPIDEDPIDIDSVHIFGFSHLPYLHFSFFDRLSKKIPISMYHLSPCMEFWSDTLSDRDAKRFFKKKKLTENVRLEFEEYLSDRHPLLANLGKVGREFAFLIEESGWPTVESYDVKSPEHQLEGLQNDLLMLKQSDGQWHSGHDGSIQIHISSTKHREIQNLFHTLKSIMGTHSIEPKDILVMAPDIAEYAPYIQTYFGTEIPYKIADLPVHAENPEILALFKLLQLEEKRWSAAALLALFNNPLFRKKQKWEDAELASIRKWVEDASILWGINVEHANVLLQNQHCEFPYENATSTWEEGLKRLYKNLAQFQERRTIDIVESELLGEVSFLIESLYRDLRPLYDGTKKSCDLWADYLKTLFSTYFASVDDSLVERLLEMKETSKPYAFSELWPLFHTFLGRDKVTLNKHQRQAVTFCTMLPMCATPAKVVVLIGMQHEAFPRKDAFASFNLLLKEKDRDYFPSRQDSDRYLFLESLLSARKFFLLSYLGKSPYDQTPLPESSTISELERFLRPKNIVVHPDASFDPQYFHNPPPLLKNHSEKDYKAALALLHPQKMKPEFFSFHETNAVEVPVGDHVIDINQLKRLCRTPITCFLEKNYAITFKEQNPYRDVEEFLLSSIHLGQARQMLGQKTLEEVTHTLVNTGALPTGTFKKLALYRLGQDHELIRPYSLKTVHFSLGETEVSFDEKLGWKCPALTLHYDEKRTIRFVGKIPGVCQKGLFALDRAQFSTAIKYWSDFVILNFSQLFDATTMVFGKDQKEKMRFFQDATPFLKTLVDYYFYAQKIPSILLPEWASSIMEGEWSKLQSLFEKENSYDKGAFWIFRELPLEKIDKPILSQFSTFLYKGMKDAWF